MSSGGARDWMYSIGVELTYTIELRDEGEYAFILPEDQIIPSGEEFLPAVLEYADYTETKVLASSSK